jgi:hypothetical protein
VDGHTKSLHFEILKHKALECKTFGTSMFDKTMMAYIVLLKTNTIIDAWKTLDI